MCVQCRNKIIASLLAIDSVSGHAKRDGRDRSIPSFSPSELLQGRDQSVHTIAEASLPQEDAVVRRWESLPPGTQLPLVDGTVCQLIFAGRGGSSVGPDVHDALLLFPDGEQRVGDIEFHVRSSDWVAHRHFSDPRYNNVILHVVLLCDNVHPTTRSDGYSIPICSLYDIPIAVNAENRDIGKKVWPCHMVMQSLSVTEQATLLHRAGLLRFEQKTQAFIETLHRDAHKTYNDCLLPALAEGLAYGRDRAFFRAAGHHLLGQTNSIPEPLGRAPAPSPLDAKRLNVLRVLLTRETDVWQSLQHILIHPAEDTILQALRAYFCSLGLSLARTDILLCNVVLPFAAAIALLEHNTLLGERAQKLYETHPGLSSNTITRMMCRQLLLVREPHGSCRQQGLHYIYQQTCQSKRCGECMMGRNIL